MTSAVQPPESTPLVRRQRRRLVLGGLAAAFAIVTALAWGTLSLVWPESLIHIHVRWKSEVTDGQRFELERRFNLSDSQHTEGTTWRYQLDDSSTANLRAIVQNDLVDDTEHVNRIRYRPEFAQDRSRQLVVFSLTLGTLGAGLLLVLAVRSRQTTSLHVPSFSEFIAAARTASARASARARDSILRAFTEPGRAWQPEHRQRPDDPYPLQSRRVTGAVLFTAVLASIAMTWLAGATPWSAAAALLVVYGLGYVVGSLLVVPVDGLSWAVIRTVTGLLLTAVGFLLSLVLSLPWFSGPAALLAAAVWFRGRRAFSWPHSAVRLRWDGIATGILVVVLVAPIGMTFFYMAPGDFPPVLYNVDTAPFLEKVHGLVAANTYPPESLSNVGARRTYHYGTQAMAAVISRSSGLLPHHSLFLIVLPLLTAGVVAAAVAVARHVSPALPYRFTVPLLLISTPSLSSSFWEKFGPQLWSAATSPGFALGQMVGDYRLWGILSNEGKNVGGDFLILGSIAAIATAPARGWGLAAFLIGSAIVVKVPVGVALLGGFLLAETWRAAAAKRFWPTRQMVMAGVVFIATLVAFFLGSSQSTFRVEPFPLYHLNEIVESNSVSGLALDFAWLFLPVLIVLTAGIKDPEGRSAPILVMGIAPLLIVNMTRLNSIAAGGAGPGSDWLQILHSVPFMLHAFALSLASRRWSQLGSRRRAAVLVTLALAVLPVAIAAGRYSLMLLRNPDSGHEFVDNRSLAEALAVIPTQGTIIVTNDLRYPAQNFTRDDRQMQLPALFGHQAFAVNYAYEVVEGGRRELQKLLQRPEWSEAIQKAARMHKWTHLVIRKDYVHPSPIPLQRIFENDFYAVFRFS